MGKRGLERLGRKKWQKNVVEIVERLVAAIMPDDVVIGGGNAKKLKDLSPGTRFGTNASAFTGGLRLWDDGIVQSQVFTWNPDKASHSSECVVADEENSKKAKSRAN